MAVAMPWLVESAAKGWGVWGAALLVLTACASTDARTDDVAPFGATDDLALIWPVEGASSADLSSTFGPRQKASEAFRYDFHRGIDIPAPLGTPVRAVADGEVRIAGLDDSYSDALVQLRHYRAGARSCGDSAHGCFYSNYMHLQRWVVSPGEHVSQGQIVGYSGTGESGFPHLHFEIRSGGIYQRYAIHPLRMLPVVARGTEAVHIETFLVERHGRLFVDVFLAMPREKLDVERVVVSMKDASSGRVTDERDYDMGEWNYEWTHTPEEWPAVGCPLHATHPAGQAYDPNVHMDDPTFNQAEIVPAKFNAKSSEYRLELVFEDVAVPAAEEDRVLTVEVMDARGNASKITVEGIKILRRNPS